MGMLRFYILYSPINTALCDRLPCIGARHCPIVVLCKTVNGHSFSNNFTSQWAHVPESRVSYFQTYIRVGTGDAPLVDAALVDRLVVALSASGAEFATVRPDLACIHEIAIPFSYESLLLVSPLTPTPGLAGVGLLSYVFMVWSPFCR